MEVINNNFELSKNDFADDTKAMFTPSKDKPIKMVFEGDVKVTVNGNDVEIKRKLSNIEAEKLLKDIFGTTNIGVLDCNNINEDTYYCPTCERLLDLTEIDSCMNTPNEIVDYCSKCQSEVINLKEYYDTDNMR